MCVILNTVLIYSCGYMIKSNQYLKRDVIKVEMLYKILM